MDMCDTEDNFRNVLKALADQVFDFFSNNARVWPQISGYLPLFDFFTEREGIVLFNSSVKKAVVVLIYLFRNECRKKFKEMSDELKNEEIYENYVMNCFIPKDCYMSHLLAWMALLLDLTTYCYTEGNYYSEVCKKCLVKYPDIVYFYEEGGWQKFHETADLISVFYDPLITSFCGKFPESDIIVPFLKALDDVSKFNKHVNTINQFRRFRTDCKKSDVPEKLRALLPYNLERIRFGALVRRKNEPADKSRGRRKVCSPKSENLTAQKVKVESRNKREDTIPDLKTFKHLTISDNRTSARLEDKTDYMTGNVPLAASSSFASGFNEYHGQMSYLKEYTEFDYSNSVFIISDSYLKKRQNSMKKGQKPKFKMDVKIYSPKEKRTDMIEKVDEILFDNINKNNISPISDEVLAIGPPEWKDKCEDYNLIVLNSSSEEEDDDVFDSSQRSVMLHVYQVWPDIAPCHITIMKLVLKERVWEAKSENLLVGKKNLNQRTVLGTLADAPIDFKISKERDREWYRKSVFRD